MTTLLCDGCGKPPLLDQKLLVCSRCKKSRYHDVQCQRKHHRQHKQECVVIGMPAKPCHNKKDSSEIVIRQESDISGWGVFATTTIAKHTKVVNLAHPFVPPLLNSTNRQNRCSFCFQQLPKDSSTFKYQSSISHFHCSSLCRSKDTFWEWEKNASERVPSGHEPTPTVFFVTRILRRMIVHYDPSNRCILDQKHDLFKNIDTLISNFDKLSYEEMESCEAIAQLSLLLLCRTPPPESLSKSIKSTLIADIFPVRYVTMLVSKIMMNAFNISDGEGVALGFGLYLAAAAVNHSCDPNAIQTFCLAHATPPRLNLTTCAKVQVGNEVTIAYIDTTPPTSRRKTELWKSYKFVCNCSKCQNRALDNAIVGIRCPKGCDGCAIQILHDLNSTDATKENSWICKTCSETDFSKSLSIRDKAMASLETLVGRKANSMYGNIDSIRTEFQTIKSCCCITSWFIFKAGEELLHCILDVMELTATEDDALSLGSLALQVIDEIDHAANACCNSDDLRRWIFRCKRAKLQLFLKLEPWAALQTLRDAYEQLSYFYPPGHEILCEILKCIQ